MNILSFIESLEAVGVTPEKILAALKEQHKKQQESTRLRVKKHRNNNKPVTDVTIVTQSSVTPVTSPPSPSLPLLSPTPPYNSNPPSPSPQPVDDELRARVSDIFSKLEKIINSPSPLISAPISKWLAAGADYEFDIRPCAERWKAKHPDKPMASLDWLSEAIASSIKQRTGPMPDVTNASRSPPLDMEAHLAAQNERLMRKYAEPK